MWCFNRERDKSEIKTEIIDWKGPFSWPGYEDINHLDPISDASGVYLFTFPYRDGFVLYSAGISKSIKRRLKEHGREYIKGNYNILDMNYAVIGERVEIWHGWKYAKEHRYEFESKKDEILPLIKNQLSIFRIFTAEVSIIRNRERIESSLMNTLYLSKDQWSDLACRGMALKGRNNSEMPINIINDCSFKIYGMPSTIEI
jgi:hypothetical protein